MIRRPLSIAAVILSAVAMTSCAAGTAEAEPTPTRTPYLSDDDMERARWQCITFTWGYGDKRGDPEGRAEAIDYCESNLPGSRILQKQYIEMYEMLWKGTDPAFEPDSQIP